VSVVDPRRERRAKSAPECHVILMSRFDRTRLTSACRKVGLSTPDLFWRYVGLGGGKSTSSIDALLEGDSDTWTRIELDTLIHAINERYQELGEVPPVPYIDERGDTDAKWRDHRTYGRTGQ